VGRPLWVEFSRWPMSEIGQLETFDLANQSARNQLSARARRSSGSVESAAVAPVLQLSSDQCRTRGEDTARRRRAKRDCGANRAGLRHFLRDQPAHGVTEDHRLPPGARDLEPMPAES
jgi:hypothetical protein